MSRPSPVTTIHGHGLGWVPSDPHHPDSHRPLLATAPIPVPETIDLSADMGPVLNQGSIGCCTAAATSSLVMHAHITGKQKDFTPSMLFNYWFSRKRLGWQNVDQGSTCANALASAVNEGICAQDQPIKGQWVFDPAKVNVEPTEDAIIAAQHHRANWHWGVQADAAHIAQALAHGYPVQFGMTVYSGFYQYWETGIVPLPVAHDTVEGGHSMVICGLDQARQLWLVKNSWGPLNPAGTCPYPGYLWLPMSYPVWDCWVVARESS